MIFLGDIGTFVLVIYSHPRPNPHTSSSNGCCSSNVLPFPRRRLAAARHQQPPRRPSSERAAPFPPVLDSQSRTSGRSRRVVRACSGEGIRERDRTREEEDAQNRAIRPRRPAIRRVPIRARQIGRARSPATRRIK